MIENTYSGKLCESNHDDGQGFSTRYIKSNQCVDCVRIKSFLRNAGKSNRKVILDANTLKALRINPTITQEDLSELVNNLLLQVSKKDDFIRKKAYRIRLSNAIQSTKEEN